ncbi:MAG: BRO family protein [Bacteroidaceae bacterium]|nr:BRO family protein [Bacteroidaceae bacterium]MDY5191456.1 BRO family protein [Bacteroidaceae bacterium]
MSQKEQIQLFEEKKVRTVWDDEKEEWFFSVVDVVEVLTDSANPTDYLKKMRKREPELGVYIGTNCPQVTMTSSTGKKRKTLAATIEQLFRIIQSIPSPKAEPFKQWMAEVAAARLNQMQDPELSIDQAVADYKRLGYSDAWIKRRIKSIEIRKDLTDQWDKAGVKEGQQYASLTDIITRAWSGKTTKQYKQFKGLKKESLRDNMTNLELALNMFAESATAELHKEKNPHGYNASAQLAKAGGKAAEAARLNLEEQLGHSIISREKATDYLPPADRWEALPEEKNDNDNE